MALDKQANKLQVSLEIQKYRDRHSTKNKKRNHKFTDLLIALMKNRKSCRITPEIVLNHKIIKQIVNLVNLITSIAPTRMKERINRNLSKN